MINPNKYHKIGKIRAFMHLIILPIVIFSLFFVIDKQYSLVVPMAYIMFIALVQYLRLIKTDRVHLKIYSRTFFDVLKQLTTFALIAIVLILLGVIL